MKIAEAEHCPDKRQRPHIFHSQGQGDLANYKCTESLLEVWKGSNVNQVFSLKSILGKRCTHIHGNILKYTIQGLRFRQSKLIGQRKPGRNVPCKWFKLLQCCNSLSPSVFLSMCTLFLLINTLLVSLLSISMWKFISIQLMGQGLITGYWCLGFSAFTAKVWLQSLFGNQNPASIVESTWDHYCYS